MAPRKEIKGTKSKRSWRRSKTKKEYLHGNEEEKAPGSAEVTDIDEEAVAEVEAREAEKLMEQQVAVKLISWPRGRRKWTLWRDAGSSVEELHWEFARCVATRCREIPLGSRYRHSTGANYKDTGA